MTFQIKRGTNSQRLGYTAAAGELIYTTDTKNLYVGDGTSIGGVTVGPFTGIVQGVASLNGITGILGLSAGAGLTLSRSGNTFIFSSTAQISVKDFGAVGNGIADDTAAIQAALNFGIGKAVYVPAGSYKTTSRLELPANTVFYGESGRSIINVQPTGSTATLNTGILFMGSNSTIDGLGISGSNEFNTNASNVINLYAAAILSDPQISGTVARNLTIKNCQIFKWGLGIELRRADNSTISGNRIWGGAQKGNAILDNGTSDISIYGSAVPFNGSRYNITNNFCFGNQDVGIGFNGIKDRFVVCSGNIIQPMLEDGITPVGTGSNNLSRYGILYSYVGGDTGTSSIISNNIITDYGHCGINSQVGTSPGGDASVVGNVVTNCGFSTVYPGDASLKGGIWVEGGAETITANVVVDCYRAGILFNAGNAIDPNIQHSRGVISSNNISRVYGDPNSPSGSGWGIDVSGANVNGVLVAANRVERSSNIGIRASGQNVHISDNSIDVRHAKGGIQVSQSGNLTCSVTNNRIVGSDNTTIDQYNSGIWFSGIVQCIGNVINNFYNGINRPSVTGRDISTNCSSNSAISCRNGIASGGAGSWIIQANNMSGCTADLQGTVYQGILLKAADSQAFGGGFNVICCDTTIPSLASGNWQVGDRFFKSNPSVGQPKSWVCTTAGTPGTWTSEGNLS